MIYKATITNYKCLRGVKIDLERFTVFVGPNASGKSSILQGLDTLCRAFRTQDVAVETEITQSLSRGANGPVELLGKVDETWYRYRTRTSASPPNPMLIHEARWSGEGRGFLTNLAADDWRPWNPAASGTVPLPASVLLRLEASKLIQNTVGPDPTAMSPDGMGLHAALASMALSDPDSWQRLQADLRRVIPTIRRLRHTPTIPNQFPALLFDTVGADSLPARQVSEGTLLVLGLLAALHAAGRPSLVLLDDLDRALHPRAQKELILLLRGLMETNPDLQILATTHSPYMLDCMETSEVRMTFLGDDGATVCAPLASHPKFNKWKDEMTPGEMWSVFGEKWLVEQGAAS